MRLFAALSLAPECAERLTNFRLRWSVPGDGLRWSPPEQWHITLRFFGDVNEALARRLEEQFQKLRAPAPVLVMEGLEMFAAKGILVASVQPSAALLELHASVAACGPHVTLARSKGRSGNASLGRLARPSLPTLGPAIRWTPDTCLLLESILRPQGAEYTVRSQIALERVAELQPETS